MEPRRHVFLCLLLCLSSYFYVSAAQKKYVLVLLGDSTTDTGNTYRAAGVPDPQSYGGRNGTYVGRFTNGPNWVDYLNETLSKKISLEIHNYAFGGGTACANPLTENFAPFIKNVTSQAADFIADVKSGKIKVDANTQVLVIQWIGSNDYLFALPDLASAGAGAAEAQMAALVAATTKCRVDNLRTLAALKGVVTDIAVLPILPMDLSPQVPAAFKPQVKFLLDVAGSATVAAVQALQRGLYALPAGSPGAGVNLHIFSATGDWIARGAARVRPPFKYTDVPCLVNPNPPVVITPGLKACANPEDYLFYDDSHPTSRFHQWVALKGILPRLQNLRLLPL